MSFIDDVFVNAAAAVDAVGKAATEVFDKSKVFISTTELRNKISASFETLGRYVYNTNETNTTDPAVVEQYVNEISELITELKNLQDSIAAASGKKVCPVCDASNSSDSLYCKKCGTSLDFNNTYTVNKKSEKAENLESEPEPVGEPEMAVEEDIVLDIEKEIKDTEE